jgi:putative transcriptional regulator
MIKSNLKALMEQNSISQRQLSIKTGIRPQTLKNMTDGSIKQIPVEAVNSICELFNCRISDIFEYEKEK